MYKLFQQSDNSSSIVCLLEKVGNRVPLLLCLLGHPGGHADDGRGEEEGGGQVEGGVLTTRVVHQPAGQGRS